MHVIAYPGILVRACTQQLATTGMLVVNSAVTGYVTFTCDQVALQAPLLFVLMFQVDSINFSVFADI